MRISNLYLTEVRNMSRSISLLATLLGIIALICIASATASVGNIQITPSGDLVSGQSRASASFIILLSSSGGYTFDNNHVLSMDTELDNPTWTYSIVMDGIENPSKTEVGPNIHLSGWELSYPSDREISVKVKMEGTAPQVDVSKEQIVFRVRELDNRNAVVSGTEVVKKKMVLNPESIGENATSEAAALANLKERIDRLAAAGVDVSAAETKYSQADAYLRSAQSNSDYVKAQSDLTQAQNLINDLKSSVPVMEAQKSIADAESTIGQTEELITYFKVNKSMGSDARLMPIIASWDIASERLTTAKDLYSEGKYDEAAKKADEATQKGNEVLATAQDLKEKVDANPFSAIGGMFSGLASLALTIGIIIVVVVLVVVAIILFRRRRRWDELG
jgi:hypothetical protein